MTRLLAIAGCCILGITALAVGVRRAENDRATVRVGYEPGMWRTDMASRNIVWLAAAHILVSHAEAAADPYVPWNIRRSDRTREAARKRIMDLYEVLVGDPDRLPELARLHSDDSTTGPLGGMLGAAPAGELPDEMLDAIDATQIGSVSRPFETMAGFHLVLPLPRREDKVVAGNIIEIKHADQRDAPLLTRSRSEALSMADRAMDALGRGELFDAVAKRFSDSYHNTAGADWGRWTTYENGFISPFVAGIAALQVGDHTPLLDTPRGFIVIQRSDATRRKMLAAEAMVFRHQELKYGPPSRISRSEAYSAAQQTLAELLSAQNSKEAWTEACKSHLCFPAVRWHAGQRPDVDQAVSDAQPGRVSSMLVENYQGIFLFFRRDLASVPAPSGPRKYALQSRPLMDLAKLVRHVSARELSWGTRAVGILAVRELDMSDREEVLFDALVGQLADRFQEVPADERAALLLDARGELEDLLGHQRSRALSQIINRWIYQLQLPG